MTLSEISSQVFSRNVKSNELELAIRVLESNHRVKRTKQATKGRGRDAAAIELITDK